MAGWSSDDTRSAQYQQTVATLNRAKEVAKKYNEPRGLSISNDYYQYKMTDADREYIRTGKYPSAPPKTTPPKPKPSETDNTKLIESIHNNPNFTTSEKMNMIARIQQGKTALPSEITSLSIDVKKEAAKAKADIKQYEQQKAEKELEPYNYLLEKAEPKNVAQLKILSYIAEKGPRMPPKFRDTITRTIMTRAYESLDTAEKEEFGYKFTDWDDISLNERKYYPGFETYRQNLSTKQKELMVEDYLKTNPSEKFIVPARYPGLMQNVSINAGGFNPGTESSYKSIQSYKKNNLLTDLAVFAMTKGGSSGEIKYPQAYENLKNAATYKLFYTEVEVQEMKKRRYETKHPLQKATISFARAGASAMVFPVTLTQTGVKYVTGKGELTDIGGRVSSGKTFLPDVSKSFAKTDYGSPQGLVGTGFSELLSGGQSDAWERFSKDPISGFSATIGETAGMIIGGKTLNIAKVGTSKALSKVGITYPARYTPINLARSAKYKILEKTGKIKYLEPEIPFQTEALPNQLSYAPGSTPQSRINATLKAFEKSKTFSQSGDDFFIGIHATTRSWYKPFVRMAKGRESSGVSIAPFGEGAPKFLRIDGYGYSSPANSISLLPQFKFPTAPLIFFKKIRQIPSYLRNKSYKASNKFIKENPGSYIAPKMYKGGAEYENIVRGWAVRDGIRYYTKVDGVIVPLPEFTLVEKASLGVSQKFSSSIPSNVKQFFSYSYEGNASIPLIRPSYAGSIFSDIIPSSKSIIKNVYTPSFLKSSRKKLSSIKRSSYSNKSSLSSSGIYSSPYISLSSSGSSKSIISSLSSGLSSYSSSLSSYIPSSGSSKSISSSTKSSLSSSSISSYSGGSSSSSYQYGKVTPPISIIKFDEDKPKRRKQKDITEVISKKYKYRQFKIKNILKDFGVD